MPIAIDIPLSEGAPLPYFDMQAPLEGVTYTLQFRWNVRGLNWYMNVLDEEGITVLLAGLCLVANWPLAAYNVERQPPGAFVCVDSTGAGLDPTLTSFGVTATLLYYTAAELGL